MAIHDLKEQIARLPEQPGVYLWRNAAGETIYVGKARALRDRVRSYLGAYGTSPRHDALLDEVTRVDVIVTDSVVEALALENHLIKQRQPRYNVLLRDDKNYPYLQLTTQEAFPRVLVARRVDRDFAIFLHEWFIKPGTATPDPTVMLDFNTFTMNGRVFPGTEPMLVRTGDRVRIRLANLTMDSHPIHIHGHAMYITGTDAGPIPESAWWPENSVNVPVGTTRDVEFTAEIVQIAIDEGATTVNIPDTVGYAMPEEYAGFLRRLAELAPLGPVVAKPFDLEAFREAVDHALEGARELRSAS